MKRMMACGALLLSLTGCFRMSIRSGAPRSGGVKEQTGVSLAYGLTTSNVEAECPNGLSRVDVYWPFWGPLIYSVTFGIVAPLRAEYVCAEGGAAPPGSAQSPSRDVPPSLPPL
jgi:hypothetical protein